MLLALPVAAKNAIDGNVCGQGFDDSRQVGRRHIAVARRHMAAHLSVGIRHSSVDPSQSVLCGRGLPGARVGEVVNKVDSDPIIKRDIGRFCCNFEQLLLASFFAIKNILQRDDFHRPTPARLFAAGGGGSHRRIALGRADFAPSDAAQRRAVGRAGGGVGVLGADLPGLHLSGQCGDGIRHRQAFRPALAFGAGAHEDKLLDALDQVVVGGKDVGDLGADLAQVILTAAAAPAALQDRMADIYSDIDTADLQDILARLMFAATLLGRDAAGGGDDG